MTITFNETAHEYLIDGRRVPSVTELLRPLTEKQFAAISPEVLRIAAERGTEVHEACECIDYGLDPEDPSADVWGYIDAYMQFLYDHDTEWYGIEEMGACTDFPVDYAGTVDRWGMVDGVLSVVDIKTVAQPSLEQKFAVTLQTTLYEWIIDAKHDMEAARHYALYLKKNGDYTLFDCDEFAVKEKILPYNEIQKLMRLYSYSEEATETLKTIKEKHRRKRDDE